jgi:hypothetical protein
MEGYSTSIDGVVLVMSEIEMKQRFIWEPFHNLTPIPLSDKREDHKPRSRTTNTTSHRWTIWRNGRLPNGRYPIKVCCQLTTAPNAILFLHKPNVRYLDGLEDRQDGWEGLVWILERQMHCPEL